MLEKKAVEDTHAMTSLGHEDEFWGKNLNICWMENGEIKIRQEPVEEIRDDLKDALQEVKDMIAERAAEQGGGN